VKPESPGALVRSILSSQLEAQGFFAQGFLDAQDFQSTLIEAGIPAEVRERYGTAETQSIAVVALNYSGGPAEMPAWAAENAGAESKSSEPRLAIARFARANWYAEIDRRLLLAVKVMRIEASSRGLEVPGARSWKRLVNSALPEKALALRAGLGWIGKNSILIASGGKGGNSAVLIGLLLCPIDLELQKTQEMPGPGCGTCRRCVDACPTGALGGQGRVFDRNKCIQHWTHIDEEPPSFIGPFLVDRLYGCDICLEACPYFMLDEAAFCALGPLGPAIPARSLLAPSEGALKAFLHGTALDRSWISLRALRRNAALSLENYNKQR
jgi:epoxyqueuosine reductase QueG